MTEPWHDECRRLRAEGLSQGEIAARLKKRATTVRLALNETDAQKIAIRRARDSLRARRIRNAPRPAKIESPAKITPEIKQAAILAFSKHEIDRGELMRRITPRSKWGLRFLRVE